MTTVVCTQPVWLPLLHWQARVLTVDRLVLMTTAQFVARNKLPSGEKVAVHMNDTVWKGAAGPLNMVVPVGAKRRPINATPLGQDDRWRANHLKSFDVAYRRAPFYDEIRVDLETILDAPGNMLSDLTVAGVLHCLRRLNADTKVYLDYNVATDDTLHGTAQLVDLTQAVGADTYIAGGAALGNYIDHGQFERAGIRVSPARFRPPVYPQLHRQGGFIANASIIDLAANVGWVEARHILIAATQPGD